VRIGGSDRASRSGSAPTPFAGTITGSSVRIADAQHRMLRRGDQPEQRRRRGLAGRRFNQSAPKQLATAAHGAHLGDLRSEHDGPVPVCIAQRCCGSGLFTGSQTIEKLLRRRQ
jgi:hypothetical protein